MITRTSEPKLKDMSVEKAFSAPASFEQEQQYRSISKAAILSLLFGILGILSFLGAAFLLLPLLGIGFGLAGWAAVAKFPLEMIGKKAAIIGLVLSLISFVGATSLHVYIYNTEVPEGYQRISFNDLRPNKRTQLEYSEKADILDGKKVFVRGYVRPGDKRKNLKEFILVGDWGQCCFGGNPKITEVIGVSIKIDDTVDYGLGVRKIGGTFRLNKHPRGTGDKEVPRIIYEIEADHVR